MCFYQVYSDKETISKLVMTLAVFKINVHFHCMFYQVYSDKETISKLVMTLAVFKINVHISLHVLSGIF